MTYNEDPGDVMHDSHSVSGEDPQEEKWASEKHKLNLFILQIRQSETVEQRISTIEGLYYYIQTIGPFLVAHHSVRSAVFNKASELLEDPRTVPIHNLLAETADWVAALE